eukprot:359931-Chlamydomonas_euryale.AAC.6
MESCMDDLAAVVGARTLVEAYNRFASACMRQRMLINFMHPRYHVLFPLVATARPTLHLIVHVCYPCGASQHYLCCRIKQLRRYKLRLLRVMSRCNILNTAVVPNTEGHTYTSACPFIAHLYSITAFTKATISSHDDTSVPSSTATAARLFKVGTRPSMARASMAGARVAKSEPRTNSAATGRFSAC